MGREDKKEPFLTNLGRATMRGLRRCQKCGTLNGTRGYACKNNTCDVIFKDIGSKKKPSTEPCKINCGSAGEIFSVRVRDKGPDYRGFVQLPTLHGNNLIPNDPVSDDILMQAGARCHVEACQRNIKFPLRYPSFCMHIRAATQCLKVASPLTLKNSALNSLPIPSDMKSEMWQLATDTSGPLVQRVSKSIMVVKCKPDTLHPLGVLHFSFHQTKGRRDNEHKFHCNCRAFKSQTVKEPNRQESYRRCVHLYSCIVAFASDDTLANEFEYFINLAKNDFAPEPILSQRKDQENKDGSPSEIIEPIKAESIDDPTLDEVSERSFLILNGSPSGTPCQVEVEVLGEGSDLLELPLDEGHLKEEDIDNKLEIQLQAEEDIRLQTAGGEIISVHQLPDVSIASLKRKQEESMSESSLTSIMSKPIVKKNDAKIGFAKSYEIDESDTHFSFLSWLESVNERIGQAMHFGFSGKPDPLVFHLPETFFYCLLRRINQLQGSKRRRITHETHTFVRKDAAPLGKFTKFTWKLTNLNQVQEVFSCNGKSLDAIRYFTQQRDGTYKPYQPPHPLTEDPMARQGGTVLRPCECKTVLRIGYTDPRLKESTPFILEWIPDILPQSQIGELRIKFEFDHFCNNQVVLKQVPMILSPRTNSIRHNRSLGPPLAPKPPLNKFPSNNDNVQISFPLSSDNISSAEGITILTF